MTRDDAVARIQRGLGFRTDLTTEIVSALVEARRLLETGRSLPDFLLVPGSIMVAPAGSDEVNFPDGFIREFQEYPFHYVSASDPDHVVILEKLDYYIGIQRFVNADRGPPVAYTMRASDFVFWPYRDIDYTLNWAYYRKSVPLDTNVSDNEWLVDDEGMPEALIGRAGMIIAADLNDTPSLQKFSSMYKTAWDAIMNESELGDEENRPLAVGSRL